MPETTNADSVLEADLADIREGRVGTAGGVHFDLIHNDFPIDDWHVPSLWQEEPFRSRTDAFPFLWFPWYGDHQSWKASKTARAIEENIDLWEPECIVVSGDRISICGAYCLEAPNTTLLDAEHDRMMAFGWLLVTRADGSEVYIEAPVPIFRKRQLKAGSYFGTEFISVLETIQRTAMSKSTDDENHYLRSARDLSCSMLRELLLRSKDDRDAPDALRLISLGVALGHMWAKAQQFSSVLPAASTGLKAQARASAAGKKSGVKRRQSRDWLETAKMIALAQIHDHTTQAELAHQIIEKLGSKGFKKIPGDTTVIKFISDLQTRGELPQFHRISTNKVRS